MLRIMDIIKPENGTCRHAIAMVDLRGVYGRYHYLLRYLCTVFRLKRLSAFLPRGESIVFCLVKSKLIA